MATGSRVCPHCGALNAADESTCHRCERRLPGPVATSVVQLFESTLGVEFPVTKLLAVLSVAVFMLSVLGKGAFPIWIQDSVRGSELIRWGALVGPLVWREPWRHVAAVFVHANALHVLFNMLWLASFGRRAEASLGPGRYAVIFVATGVVGYVVSDVWYVAWYGFVPLTMGASGAVFGVLGCYAGEAWARRSPEWKSRVGLVVALAVVLLLVFGTGVNHAAHFGGLFAGLGLGYAFGRERRPYRRDKLYNRLAAVLLAGCVASVAACNWSPAWTIARQGEIQSARH